LEQFDAAGLKLEYIEDPLPRGDFAGLRELTRRAPTRVIGHDYLNTIEDMERLVDAGIGGIRTNGDFDYMLECIRLAERHHLPVYVGNSQFEIDVHIAVAFDVVDRIEYSALGWNSLVEQPVQISDGLARAPERLGHGLVLKGRSSTGSLFPG
jgi:L-alanine-DL-glutamate epimerase-like enolase superfamily enzyme